MGEWEENGGPAKGGGGVEVQRWCPGGCGKVFGWWDLDIREFGWWDLREKGGGLFGVGEKIKGEEGKGDLKGSCEKPKTHAIERTKSS
jgi:hypothetical protein